MPEGIVKGPANAMSKHGESWAHGASVPASGDPTITSFSPDTGSVGDTVTIHGTNFDGIVTVKFYFGNVATITSQTSTQLKVTVPSGAVTGPISVLNNVGNVISVDDWTLSTVVAGVAPDYSSLVTRKSVGIGGQGNHDYLDQIPAAKISRMDIQGSVANYTELNAAINASATSIGIKFVATTLPSTPFQAKIDDEYVNVTGISGSGSSRTLTATRGVRGSTAASHAINAGVTTFNWSTLDGKIKKTLDLEIEILAMIAYNNTDYSGWGDQMAVPVKNGGTPHSDANGHTFAQWSTWYAEDFAKEIMQRYSRYGNAKPTSGVLASKIGTTTASGFNYSIKFVEVWNESNNIQFWGINNQSDYTLYGNDTPAKDYAELLAKVYDAIKDISANIYVGNAGFAARAIGYAKNGSGPKEYMQDMCDRFGTMGYTKHANGWAAVPLDFICHHPYGPNGRTGGSQVFANALSPLYDNPSNKFAVVTVQVHNVAHSKGWGSLKVWGTECDNNWAPICVTGYGFRGDPPSSSYVQHGGGSTDSGHVKGVVDINDFPSYDRSMMSANEEYSSVRIQYRIWMGLDAWPARTDNTAGHYLPRWEVLGKDTPLASDPLPLGPRFHFAGGKDFHHPIPYPEPYLYEDHFGLWDHDGNKKVAATGKDPHDALAEFTKFP